MKRILMILVLLTVVMVQTTLANDAISLRAYGQGPTNYEQGNPENSRLNVYSNGVQTRANIWEQINNSYRIKLDLRDADYIYKYSNGDWLWIFYNRIGTATTNKDQQKINFQYIWIDYNNNLKKLDFTARSNLLYWYMEDMKVY